MASEVGDKRTQAVVVAISDGTTPLIVDVAFDDGSTASVSEERIHSEHLAVKIMEKLHIMKNEKVYQVKDSNLSILIPTTFFMLSSFIINFF